MTTVDTLLTSCGTRTGTLKGMLLAKYTTGWVIARNHQNKNKQTKTSISCQGAQHRSDMPCCLFAQLHVSQSSVKSVAVFAPLLRPHSPIKLVGII
ncbi:uncharacterized protein LAJ45_08397 [Morchella importuna]|uniref:uncharacterized protein n=1 Tax=Morchella importuna TaxID=1174673 RepID=UPI001E8D6A3F|nr:uncharacterized protein LAJ45_08397 [Morchella importuna]KAH8147570.1 hypothetical protein LAJ45_08397 [Morchella importuna]